jgi:hypothetical protein
MRQKLSIFLIAAFLCLSAAMPAATIEGVAFADSWSAEGQELRLVGTGLQRYLVVYKVCVAALYLPADVVPKHALKDVGKRLEIHYFHDIDAESFATLTVRGVRDNATPEQFEAVRVDLERFVKAYARVRVGDRYSLTYLPATGTTLALNGKDRITIPGANFAAALFAVWLGERPVTSGLRAGLLGSR